MNHRKTTPAPADPTNIDAFAPGRPFDTARASHGRFLADAPRQPSASEAWGAFAGRLADALRALEEDEWLVLHAKRRNRFLQVMNQGNAGIRVETVSNFYLADGDRLSEVDQARLLDLGWSAPDKLPDAMGHSPDGSPNYYLDLANPVPLDELAAMSVATLAVVHGVEHPNQLEYSMGSADHHEVRLSGLGIKRAQR